MPKLHHYDNLNTARFVTFCCYHRQKLLTAPSVIETFLEALSNARDIHKFRLLGYVIMPEHVHLVIHPQMETKLGPLIGEIKSKSAAKIITGNVISLPDICLKIVDGKQKYSFWQPRCYDHNCRTPETVLEKINYCHNNPVRQGLATEPGDWRWSSYNWYVGKKDVAIEIDKFEELALNE